MPRGELLHIKPYSTTRIIDTDRVGMNPSVRKLMGIQFQVTRFIETSERENDTSSVSTALFFHTRKIFLHNFPIFIVGVSVETSMRINKTIAQCVFNQAKNMIFSIM